MKGRTRIGERCSCGESRERSTATAWVCAGCGAEVAAIGVHALRAERAPAVSRDAGEALYAALEELGVADDLDSAAVERAAVHVERYGERREEAGAEGEREQRAIERRGGPGR